jgi:hypothetical protein
MCYRDMFTASATDTSAPRGGRITRSNSVNEVTLTQSADAVARPDTVTWLIQSQDNDPTFPLDPELDAAARPMDAGGVNAVIDLS